MKKYLLSILCLLYYGSGLYSQCINTISTNPDESYSNDLENFMAPTVSGVTINPFINIFDWANRDQTGFIGIPLEPNAGWQINDFTSFFQMQSPYSPTSNSNYQYLYDPIGNINERDFHWEDGWELLWLGTGYYPNGEAINSVNNSRVIAQSQTLHNTRIPYIILYNRYTSVMRLFMNVFTELGQYDNAMVTLRFQNNNNASGVLRAMDGIFRPLDELSKIEDRRYSTQAIPPNITRWFSVDFEMSYDPCICNNPAYIVFDIKGFSKLDVSLLSRGIQINDVPVYDPSTGTTTYDKDFLSVHNAHEDFESGGLMIYSKMDELIQDYIERLEKYEQDLEDYQKVKGSVGSAITFLKAAKSVLQGVASNLPFGELALYISEQAFSLGLGGTLSSKSKPISSYSTPPTNGSFVDDGSKVTTYKVDGSTVVETIQSYADIKKGLVSGSKSLIGSGFDYLVSNIKEGLPTKPIKPSSPSASYEEAIFAGTITNEDMLPSIGPLFVPGSYSTPLGINNYDYPAYNKPLGLTAVLTTPTIKYNDETIIETGELIAILQEPDESGWDIIQRFSDEFELNLKLTDEIKFVVNEALDIEKGDYKYKVVVELDYLEEGENEDAYYPPHMWYSQASDSKPYFEYVSGNLQHTNTFTPSPSTTAFYENENKVMQLESSFMDLENVGAWIGGRYKYGWYMYTVQGPLRNWGKWFKPRVKRVLVKVMSDFVFDQIGSDGDEVTTQQVLTLELFNRQKSSTSPYWNTYSLNDPDIPYYTTGEVDLIEEGQINLSNSHITSIDGNDIYIDAESINIYGDISVISGYNLFIRSLIRTEIFPNSDLGVNVLVEHLPKLNFHPSSPLNSTDVNAFCTDSENGYKANAIEARSSGRKKNASSIDINLEYGVYPNPTSSNVTFKLLDLSQLEESSAARVQLFNLHGQLLLHDELNSQALKHFELDFEGLPAGTYIIKIEGANGNIHFSRKLIKL